MLSSKCMLQFEGMIFQACSNQKLLVKPERSINMEEKTYKIMNGAGAMSIAVGVVTLVTGIVCGILMVIGGAKLLAGKSKILF